MDQITKQKMQLEYLLGRRLRGTLTTFIREWNKTPPGKRGDLIKYTSAKMNVFLEGFHRRSNTVFKNQRPVDLQARSDTQFLMGRVVDSLLKNEGGKTRKTAFTNGIRKWATGAARRITLRDTEKARHEAASNLVGAVYKVWLSLLDGNERADHQDAHFRYAAQPIPINQPFLIGKRRFKMMHPGDISFGAPPELFMGCRCKTGFLDKHGKLMRR